MNTAIYIILGIVVIIALAILINYVIVVINAIKKNKTIKKSLGSSTKIRIIYQLKEALEALSKTKTGAIITIENNNNLDLLRTDGIILDANISSSLLISIFNKHSPLHDGAVVIRNNKIYYAATFYKITKKSIDNKYGARHRASLGISEMSDSSTLIVSEENGGITLAENGTLQAVPIENLQSILGRIFKDTK
ncbi:diadenylate cyclase [Metamycoplasma gateae]|uniref:DNA integrity scanning protein DisA nucleotide-binding domain protein n=1 Tax=Metamycoplasma gateae TaxID=35769 RepID=A0ABZ2ALP8_9BACT|nr:DNA integrity scanning protein DisA nucleotide-binding domain protein [Metamycoplasma gateae]